MKFPMFLLAAPLVAGLSTTPALATVIVNEDATSLTPGAPFVHTGRGAGDPLMAQVGSHADSCITSSACNPANAFASAEAGFQHALKLLVRVDGESSQRGVGTTALSGAAQATFADTLTVMTNDSSDHRLVTLHKTITLDEEYFGDHGFVEDGGFTANRSNTLEITSEGLAPGAFGNLYAFHNERFDGDNEHTDMLVGPQTIDFALTFALNEATSFSISELLSGHSFIDSPHDRDANVVEDFGVQYTLGFGDGLSITDAATGQALCGLNYSSASELNYGFVSSCGGGGGGGDGGGGGGGGAVPEPSTWALLLAGFGGLGATLRRRRAARATLQAGGWRPVMGAGFWPCSPWVGEAQRRR